MPRIAFLFLCFLIFSAQTHLAPTNLLQNPEFRFYPFENLRDPAASADTSHLVPAWDTDASADIEVKTHAPTPPASNIVTLHPGKHLRQFITLPEINCVYGDTLSLSVQATQSQPNALHAQIFLLRVDSEDGTWSPADLKLTDKRTFAKHGRGELVPQLLAEQLSDKKIGPLTLRIENTKITGQTKSSRDSSKANTNAVALLIDFENASTADLEISSPCLTKSASVILRSLPSSRTLPTFYRQIPNTMQKLFRGEPLHILALGSSVDHGDANPHLYAYDEDPKSPTYKQPLRDYFYSPMPKLGHPELADYIPLAQERFVYSGRLRLDLLRQFDIPINKVLLNLMAAGGSSIGESHAGFIQFGDLVGIINGETGTDLSTQWKQLYAPLYARKDGPHPDLVIFGHGENEHVDTDQEPAVFEAAIRLFQRHYPGVECVFCIWPRDGKTLPFETELKALAAYYNIPYIELKSTVLALDKTCNPYALCPDGGHPQAAMHKIWSHILEQAFLAAAPLEPDIPQRQLPPRLYPHAYLWEGDHITYTAPDPRIVTSRMILDDCAFNLWATSKDGKDTKLLIDGKPVDCGHGSSITKRDSRNSSFVHGLLTLGDRHILELQGDVPQIVAADCKIPPNKIFYDVTSPLWTKSNSAVPPAVTDFQSDWGRCPFGNKKIDLKPGGGGQSLSLEVTATDIAIAYIDQPDAGSLRITIDGKTSLTQPANLPFLDSDKKKHYLENRKALPPLPLAKHKIQIQAVDHPVAFLGLFTYNTK